MTKQNNLFGVVVLTLLVAFFMGAYLLESMGIPYTSEGGNPFLKIHLYSYLIFLSVASIFFGGRGHNYINGLGELKPYWKASIACIVFVIIYGLYRQGMAGMAYVLDTFLTPMLLIPLLLMLNARRKAQVVKLLAWLLLLNSLIAITEFSLSSTLVYVEFLNFSHFRSPALLAHPLNNALITVTLAPLLMTKTRVPPLLYFLIVLLSLFAFGGRSAMGVFIIASIAISSPTIKQFLTQGVVISKAKVAFYQLVFLCVVIGLAYALLLTSIGDRILSKMYIDGSAQARFDVFFILDEMAIQDWIFGVSNQFKDNIIMLIGIKTIENYIIGWIVSFGLIGTIPLIISVFAMPIRMAINMPLNAKVAVVTLFLVSISNNALTTKTTALVFFFTIMTCLQKREKEN